ncbi:MAG TPA: PDZ domain-containing protein, partial [Acidimicrobiales bacterium]|nr:PDZ domain-containing protein [Acidimicrobiales bacterium]
RTLLAAGALASTAVLGTGLAAGAGTPFLVGASPPPGAGAGVTVSPSLPDVHLDDFLPSGSKVTRAFPLQMGAGGPPDLVVTFDRAKPRRTWMGPAKDFLIITWSAAAHRWRTSFDGGSPATSSVWPDHTTSGPIPQQATVYNLTVAPMSPAPGRTDLAFWAYFSPGFDAYSVAGIVRSTGAGAVLAYSTSAEDDTDVMHPRVVGPRGRQELLVPKGELTLQDPACCPGRTYVETVALGPHGYGVVSSTEPWLGVFVDAWSLGGTGSTSPITVVGVVPGSPALGALSSGDVVEAVEGPGRGSKPKPLLDSLADVAPGATARLRVQRNGRLLEVEVRMGAMSGMAYPAAAVATPGYFGVDDQVGDPSRRPNGMRFQGGGVKVLTVDPASPAWRAGIRPGDAIVSIGQQTLTSSDALLESVFLARPGSGLHVDYVDTAGQYHSVTVLVGRFPSGYEIGRAADPVIIDPIVTVI